MDKKRKETIVQEINYWKQNKLLPDAYCDFLMNLYTSGEGEFDTIEKQQKNSGKNLVISGVSLAAGLFTVIALIFGELALATQALISILVSAGIMIVSFNPSTSPLVKILSRILAAFIVLLFSVDIWRTYFSDQIHVLYLIIGVQCILWAIAGFYSKQQYFTISGVIGTIVLLFLYL
ncbi:hypothetical protein JMA_21690 [Jeotgalibacillus malaysiensis]|uniref:DUF2157 domain-containing protein n=1 Tax=Jeotgalibacillus malaysiensis TaxID=1508404 RepID=A0A0B5AMW9_9BACL|nr:hypothetical protein [Jeotgalibacillus malaysiensis]AJD91486.1 hypothetical protein JMA_21690 [Jeotgalibacillus malaysiensis]